MTASPSIALPDVAERADLGLAAELDRAHRHTDRLFARLMVAQWLAGIAVALWISPLTWIGARSEVHSHVWAAIVLGGGLAALPVYLCLRRPGRPLTRHVVAVAQMLVSALLIHLTGGRIETHFHVFGSLAFLAFYRDWRVLATATAVVALDHMLRGVFWPQSVFGVMAATSWRWLEHAGWVLFEVAFLTAFISQSRAQMMESAGHRARLEVLNQEIEARIAERTAELQRSEKYLRAIFETEPECVKLIDREGNVLDMNPAGLAMIGARDLDDALGRCVFDFIEPGFREAFQALNDAVFRGESVTGSYEVVGIDGSRRSMETHACPLRDDKGEIVAQLAITRDVTERRRAETELEQAQLDLVAASRRAGMAEVASSVLHNVGNVLNSVNVSCSVIASSVRKSRSSAISRVATLVRENAANLPEFFADGGPGSQIPDYLDKLARGIDEQQESTLREIQSLVRNIDHIKGIIELQQLHGRDSLGAWETLAPAEVAEEALRINHASLERHGIEIVRDYEDVPPIPMERHKVLQILVNLVRNARQATAANPWGNRRITMSIESAGEQIAIRVVDNGVGIAAENLTRIFSHGFTTKKDGHGFGLHSGALAARQMGGSLEAHSDGPGKGASFTLLLKLEAGSAAPAEAEAGAA